VLKLKRIFAVIHVIFQLTLAGNHSLVASTILESKSFGGEAEKSTFTLLEISRMNGKNCMFERKSILLAAIIRK
jgi:hypothetical protein